MSVNCVALKLSCPNVKTQTLACVSSSLKFPPPISLSLVPLCFSLFSQRRIKKPNLSLSLEKGIMVFGKGSMKKSNLDRFLHCTTPVVPPQSLPKVSILPLFLSFFLSFFTLKMIPFFLFCRRRLGA